MLKQYPDALCINLGCGFDDKFSQADNSWLHSPFLEKNSKHHDAVKHTNAAFGWGTKFGTEYLALERRIKLVSETSYNEEIR